MKLPKTPHFPSQQDIRISEKKGGIFQRQFQPKIQFLVYYYNHRTKKLPNINRGEDKLKQQSEWKHCG